MHGADARARSERPRAVRLFVRGYAYRSIGANDPAIADFTDAIRLRPAFADSYLQRGALYAFEGRDRLAIADFERAIARCPKFDGAFLFLGNVYLGELDYERALANYRAAAELRAYDTEAVFQHGVALFESGDAAAAAVDFRTALHMFPYFTAYTSAPRVRNFPGEFYLADLQRRTPAGIDPRQPYAVILLHVARSRTGGGDGRESARGVATLDADAWPIPVVHLFLGTVTPAALERGAEESDPALRPGEMCEAATFLGEYALLRHDVPRARRSFDRAIERCPHPYLAHQLARAEVSRLSGRREAP